MIIRKKLPRSHKLYEPIRHEGSHPRPVTRRDFMATGFLSSSAVLIGSSAMVAAFTNPRAARAAPAGNLALDIQALQAACGITNGAGKIPFICFDLAGGANLNGSEILIGQAGGQLDFLSTAGYGMLGLPGDMLPNSPNTASPTGNFIDTSLGAAWHSDGAILRGIQSIASPAAMANTNGVGIAAMSQNDTSMNPHNPMYGIYDAGANGNLLTLIGTEPTVSGGNSVAPTALINLSVSPTVVTKSSDITGLVNTGQLGTMFTGPSGPSDAVNVLESTIRISGGSDPNSFGGELGQISTDSTVGTALQSATRCSYVKSTVLVNEFGDPTTLNPDIDPQIVGASGIFTPAQYTQQNFSMTAAVMKMVVNGFAGAGTISLSGFDYHDGTRATGETRNFMAGQCIGACLEYAKRVGVPLMVYVFSDGSLSSTNMIDTSAAGRGKFGWQGDNSSVAASFFLVYNPAGRPVVNPSATTPNQIGSYTAGGAVNGSSSPAANAVNLLVNTVILNYMALHGLQGSFDSTIATGMGMPPGSTSNNGGLGSNIDSLIGFEQIVNGKIGG